MPVVMPPGSEGVPLGLSASDAAIQEAQLPYMTLGEQVHAQLDASHLLNDLTGMRLDVPHRRFYVYLAGDAPSSLDALRRQAAAQGITLLVQRAAHTHSELLSATEQLSKVAGLPSGYMIELETDGSGLTLRYPGTGRLPAATLHAIEQVAASTTVPIQVRNRGPRAVFA